MAAPFITPVDPVVTVCTNFPSYLAANFYCHHLSIKYYNTYSTDSSEVEWPVKPLVQRPGGLTNVRPGFGETDSIAT
jgi:hypothetical protein